MFDSLRYSDAADAAPVQPAQSSSLPSSATLDDTTHLVVEFPDSFTRSAQPVVPVEQVIPAADPQIVEVSRGVSGVGVFFLAALAQLVILGALVGAAYVYPKEAGELLKTAAAYLDEDSAHADPAPITYWTPPEPTSTLAARIQVLELEDRAIVRGDRTAFAELQRQAGELENESANPIYDAVNASLVRIQQLYQMSVHNAPPALDAQAIFPGAQSEPDLPPASVIQVLRDRRHSAVSRERAAFLLSEVKTESAQKALFNTIQDDPNLQVVAQAFSSFQKSTGYPGYDWFDSKAVESWWYQNAPKILGQK